MVRLHRYNMIFAHIRYGSFVGWSRVEAWMEDIERQNWAPYASGRKAA